MTVKPVPRCECELCYPPPVAEETEIELDPMPDFSPLACVALGLLAAWAILTIAYLYWRLT